MTRKTVFHKDDGWLSNQCSTVFLQDAGSGCEICPANTKAEALLSNHCLLQYPGVSRSSVILTSACFG